MNVKKICDDAYRAAKKAAPQRVERRLKAILYGDVPTFMELPHVRTKEDLATIDVAFLGIPWEGLKYPDSWTVLPETAAPAHPNSIYYRTGADKAPAAIRRYSLHYSYNHSWGYFPELGRDFIIFNHLKAVDYGDVDDVDVRDPGRTLENCFRKVSEIYEAGTIPLVAGGDHSIPYPCVQSLFAHTKGNIGIITFDSHFDLYYEPEFSAASQWSRLFELPEVNIKNYCAIGIRGLRNQLHERFVAEKLGIQYYTMADVENHGIRKIIKNALEIAGKNTEALYVSLDIDVMDPAFCPGQKYPEPGGLTSREIISALRQIGTQQLIKGFDICCFSPQYDTRTGSSAQLCARLFMEVLATIAWQKKQNTP